MKWENFEQTKISIRQELDAVKYASKRVKYPEDGTRNQVDAIAGTRTMVHNRSKVLVGEINAGMQHPEKIVHAGLPWDMPSMPEASKELLAMHDKRIQDATELRDAFSKQWQHRKNEIEQQWGDI